MRSARLSAVAVLASALSMPSGMAAAARAAGLGFVGTSSGSKRYPERSARQALRGFRRAQGGPGITEGSNPEPRS